MAKTGGILSIITGAAMIAGAVAIDIATLGGASVAVLAPLVVGGLGSIISGVGSLVSGNPVTRNGISERNPISPWKVGFGLTAPKNNLVYMHQWGSNGQMLDLVMVLYDHPVSAITEVLFNQQRVQIDTNAIPTSASAGYAIPSPAAGSGTSFTPVQQTNIMATSITQSNDVVTIKLPHDIPYLTSGDPIIVKGTSGNTYSAQFSVAQILGRGGAFGALSFTILNGASMPTTVQVSTKWVDYGRTVYYEPLLGNQLLGQTFVGMTAGTPWQGTGKLVTPLSPGNAGTDNQFPAQANPWTPQCSGQGKALVFLRVNIGDTKFYPGSGLPLISFRCTGKNNIYDPRLGPATGVKVAGMTAAGASYQIPALYGTYDVLTLVQSGASGGQITVTGVNGSGAITSYVVTNAGTGYALGACTTTGGHGSGATFNIQVLGGSAGALAYTANPALCIADFCTDQKWGYKFNYGTDIPLPQLIAAANICDQQVTLAEGGTEPLWSCNGQFELTTRRGETLQNLLTSCAGRITPEPPFTISPGAWYGSGLGTITVGGTMSGYVVGDVLTVVQTGAVGGQITVTAVSSGSITAWEITTVGTEYVVASGLSTTGGSGTGATVSITALAASLTQDLQAIASGPYEWRGPTVHELYNACKGTYISPDNKWQSTDYPYYAQDGMHGYSGPLQYQNDINLAADGGDLRFFELNLPFTISSRQAQQTAKIELLRRRWANRGIQSGMGQGGTGTFLCNMNAYVYAPLDVFAGTAAFLGISAQAMEIVKTRLTLSQKEGGVALGVALDVQFTDSSIYAWSTTEELTPQGYVQSTWPTGLFQETYPLPWSPGYAAPLIGDALYPQTATTTLSTAISSPITSPTAISLAANSTVTGSYLLIGTEWFLINSGGGSNAPTVTGGQFGSTAATHSSGATVTMANGPANFGLEPVYGLDGQGNGTATLQVKGYVPINATDTTIEAPLIVCTASSTGGNLPAGTYVVGLTAWDSGSASHGDTDYQAIATVSVGGTGSGSIAVSVTWGSGDDGGDIYFGLWEEGEMYTLHFNQHLASSTTSATITTFDQTQPGGPDPDFNNFEMDWWQAIHTGLFLEQVQNVTATTVTLASYVANDVTANLFAGYTLSLQGKINSSTLVPSGEIPVLNMPVASNTASASATYNGTTAIYWTMTIGTNSAGEQLPPLNQILEVGDWVVMRGQFVFTANSLYEPNIANAYYPSGDTGVEATHLAVVLKGADAGDVQVLTGGAGSSASPWALSGNWAVTPSTGDVVIVVSASMQSWQTGQWNVGSPGLVGPVAWPNFVNGENQAWLVRIRTLSVSGFYGADQFAPMRDLLMIGSGGTRSV